MPAVPTHRSLLLRVCFARPASDRRLDVHARDDRRAIGAPVAALAMSSTVDYTLVRARVVDAVYSLDPSPNGNLIARRHRLRTS